jgi:hypothetical protein
MQRLLTMKSIKTPLTEKIKKNNTMGAHAILTPSRVCSKNEKSNEWKTQKKSQ